FCCKSVRAIAEGKVHQPLGKSDSRKMERLTMVQIDPVKNRNSLNFESNLVKNPPKIYKAIVEVKCVTKLKIALITATDQSINDVL
ncbi:hypothetical protein BWI97_26255, partial [Siphonobacter sp. BAB-5405]|uniref:hypothetical protein n=1 Tax=Siphonobacter sp. BAB-5405 TaxID=1864825 RepID=UPI000CB80F8E